MNIQEQIIQIIAENLRIDALKITPETNFKDDLMVDSLGQVELIMEFEKKFEITIPDDIAEKFEKVDCVIKYLNSIDICDENPDKSK